MAALEGTVKELLDDVEEALRNGGLTVEELGDLGFWDAAAELKRDPALADRYADRAGRLDCRAFGEKWTVSLSVGHAVALVLTASALALVTYGVTNPDLLGGLALFAAAALLATAPHPLAHFVAGRLVGIDFQFYFLDGSPEVRPTLKMDYATYLRASPRERAAVHLSAPIVSTLLPLGVLGVSIASGTPSVPLLLVAVLVGYVLFVDVLPLVGVAAGRQTLFGVDLRETDVGKGVSELRHREG